MEIPNWDSQGLKTTFPVTDVSDRNDGTDSEPVTQDTQSWDLLDQLGSGTFPEAPHVKDLFSSKVLWKGVEALRDGAQWEVLRSGECGVPSKAIVGCWSHSLLLIPMFWK